MLFSAAISRGLEFEGGPILYALQMGAEVK
jgi:hypothetical protein